MFGPQTGQFGGTYVPGQSIVVAPQSGVEYYVSPGGNDNYSGLSWATPCQTILGALDKILAIPTVNLPAATIYILDGSSVGGTMSQQGLWFLGTFDPNQPPATPPPGWRFVNRPLRFIGVGGFGISFGQEGALIGPGSKKFGAAYQGGPAIHLAGLTSPIEFNRLNFYQPGPGPCVVGGIGTDGADRISANVRFKYCGFAVRGQPGQSDTMCGPTMQFGFEFWNWITDCSIIANGSANPADDRRAAILLKGNTYPTDAPYLTYVKDCRFQYGGGIHYASNSGWDSWWEHITMEGDAAHDQPPVVRITGTGAGGGRVHIYDVTTADGFWTPPAYRADVKVDNGTQADVVVSNVPYVEGKVTMLTGYAVNYQQFAVQHETANSMGWVGPIAGRLYGQHDGGRRGLHPAIPRYENISDDFSALGTSLAPDGSTRARLTSFNSIGTFTKYGNRTFTTGDYFVFGAWTRNTTGTGLPKLAFFSQNPGTNTIVSGGPTVPSAYQVAGDYNRFAGVNLYPAKLWGSIEDSQKWTWLSGWARVVTSSVADAFYMHFEDSGGSALAGYGWTFFYVPAGDGWTDDEIAAWANDLQSSPAKNNGGTIAAPAIGDHSLFPGQRIGFWDATLNAWCYLTINNGAVSITA